MFRVTIEERIMHKTMLAGALALTMSAGTASAATLTATFNGDFAGFPGFDQTDGTEAFVIEFDDSLGTNPNLLEPNEFMSFSWINSPYGPDARELLVLVPGVAGFIADPFYTDTRDVPNFNVFHWIFQNAGNRSGSTVSRDSFNYSLSVSSPGISTVPLPASVVLLLAGLGGLAAFGRRRGA
jgi:hypothetical protein